MKAGIPHGWLWPALRMRSHHAPQCLPQSLALSGGESFLSLLIHLHSTLHVIGRGSRTNSCHAPFCTYATSQGMAPSGDPSLCQGINISIQVTKGRVSQAGIGGACSPDTLSSEHPLERTVTTLRVPNMLWADPMTCKQHGTPSPPMHLQGCKQHTTRSTQQQQSQGSSSIPNDTYADSI